MVFWQPKNTTSLLLTKILKLNPGHADKVDEIISTTDKTLYEEKRALVYESKSAS